MFRGPMGYMIWKFRLSSAALRYLSMRQLSGTVDSSGVTAEATVHNSKP